MIRYWGLAFGLVALAGCMHGQPRLQSEDESDRADREVEVKTIGDITSVANVDRIPVVGIGLVTRLEGTGGGVPPGPEKAALEDYLRKRGVENIKELFNSKTTSLVRVAAQIPAGARKGDPVDIYVSVPENSRTTSLRGGILEECLLYNYDSTHNLINASGREIADRPNTALRGHPLIKAEGKVVAGVAVEAEEEEPSLKRGVVWAGGKCMMPDRQFILAINGDQQYARVAMRIAERINETFQGSSSSVTNELAVARSKTHVTLSVPGAYRLNMGRFLRVVRLIPLNEAPAPESSYVQKLSRQLLEPATTVTAALRLEALGPASIPALKVGLHSDLPLVRFAAAESLAYLGSPSCGEELGKQVTEQPFVQAFALTALASLNEAVCRVKLQELLAVPNPETRYGAFRALRASDERDPLVAGENLGSYSLHRVNRGGGAQIHFATHGRPEIVLFGEQPELLPPFSILAGPEFTLRANEGAKTVSISRFSARQGKQTRECSLMVSDVLRTIAELGGNYADAVEVLRQADACRGVNCAVKADALPRAPTVYDLARAGVQFSSGKKGDALVGVQMDIGATPTLYEQPDTQRAAAPRD